MGKYIKVLIVLLVVLCSTEVLACEQKTGNITGGACSVSELKALENNKTESDQMLQGEKDLRPIRKISITNRLGNDECLLGTCLYRTIIEKTTK